MRETSRCWGPPHVAVLWGYEDHQNHLCWFWKTIQFKMSLFTTDIEVVETLPETTGLMLWELCRTSLDIFGHLWSILQDVFGHIWSVFKIGLLSQTAFLRYIKIGGVWPAYLSACLFVFCITNNDGSGCQSNLHTQVLCHQGCDFRFFVIRVVTSGSLSSELWL